MLSATRNASLITTEFACKATHSYKYMSSVVHNAHRKGVDDLQPHEAQDFGDGEEEGDMEHRSLSQLATGME